MDRVRAGVAFVLISKLYRQMYPNTGIATDGARESREPVARWIAIPCRRLFTARPMPDLPMPARSAARQPSPTVVPALLTPWGYDWSDRLPVGDR